MTARALTGVAVIGVFSLLASEGRGWGAVLWQLLGAMWIFYCLEEDL